MTVGLPGEYAVASDDADLVGLRTPLALGDLERHLLVLLQGAEAPTLDRRVVDEHVRASTVLGDEAEALLTVEPLHGSGSHDLFLLIGTRTEPAHHGPRLRQ